ncbi:ABC transporter permease [Ornithinimicrobium murale]|uniref:ABC transporter permease n=1 Tax=Ornithinimicrobium murale TaxID=1050153 RepID=UPI0013B37E8F|nr:ABC transporter permease [Ornithinimicrobium murale]
MAAVEQTPAATAPHAATQTYNRRRVGGLDLLCLTYLVCLATGCLLSLVLPQIDAYGQDFTAVLQPPSPEHWFGTDSNGRDIFDRTLKGGLSSIVVALLTVTIGIVVGGGLGVVGGYLGGVADVVVGTLLELLLSLPGLILVMVVITLLGPGYWTIGTLIGIFMIAPFARIARSATLAVRDRSFVQASRLLGAGPARAIVTEVIPSVLPAVGAYAFTAVTAAVVAEGSLSFLGFGLQPPEPSWGGLISEGRTHLGTAPWITLAPSMVLCATILSVNLLGQRLSTTTRQP